MDAPDHLREEVVAVPVPGFGLGTLLMPAFALFLPVPVAVAATAVVHLANNLFKLVLVGWKAGWTVVVRFALPAAAAIVDAPDRDDGGDARDQRSPPHGGEGGHRDAPATARPGCTRRASPCERHPSLPSCRSGSRHGRSIDSPPWQGQATRVQAHS